MVSQFQRLLSTVRHYKSIEAQVAARNFGAIKFLREPLLLAQQVVQIFKELESVDQFKSFKRPSVPSINTAGRRQQSRNQSAFVQLVQSAAVVRSATLAADLGSNSYRYSADSTALRNTPSLITQTEMQTARQQVTTEITDELVILSELNLYPKTQAALVKLRTDTVRHMTVEGEHLARTFTTSADAGTGWGGYMQTLVLAYRHYGALTDDVINDRNEIANPLFIPANYPIDLLAEVTD